MVRVSGDWLDAPGTQQVLGLLTAGGHQAYAVGGAVRNALRGAPVADVDIATDAHPARVAELAQAAGVTVIPTGMEHGTLTLMSHGGAYEVTTFRHDVATDGRRATVAFASRIEDDAQRRDFTMNALYADARGRVIDPLGSGIADARGGHLRFVGDAEARIREDYLRILRFFRFYAWYGAPDQGPDPDGLAASAALADGIGLLSRERIGAELRKLLSAPDPAPAIAAMAAAGVLLQVLPGSDPRGIAPLVHFEAGTPPNWLARLAVLGGEDPAAQLRLSRAEAADLAAIRGGIGNLLPPAALAAEHGAKLARAIILARASLLESPPNLGWEADVERGEGATFSIRAADLPDLSGPALGKRLKALRRYWLDHDLRPDHATLIGLKS